MEMRPTSQELTPHRGIFLETHDPSPRIRSGYLHLHSVGLILYYGRPSGILRLQSWSEGFSDITKVGFKSSNLPVSLINKDYNI